MKIAHVAKLSGSSTNGIDYVVTMLSEEQRRTPEVLVDVIDISQKVNFKKKIGDYNIVVFHSIFCFQTWVYITLCLLKKIPYIIFPHSGLSSESFNKSYWKKKIIFAIFLSRMIKKSSAIHFLNVKEKENSFLYSKHNFIIPNGMSVSDFTLKSDDRLYLGYLGRYDINHKGIDLLLQSIYELRCEFRNRKFVLIMHGFDRYGTNVPIIKKYIKENKIEDIVNVNDSLTNTDDKFNFLNNASAYILTSRYEGFPITILEALAVNTPCLVTNSTNVSDLVIDNKFGFSSDCSVESIKNMIMKFFETIDSNNMYFEMSSEYIKLHYSWKSVNDSLLAEYRGVIERNA